MMCDSFLYGLQIIMRNPAYNVYMKKLIIFERQIFMVTYVRKHFIFKFIK